MLKYALALSLYCGKRGLIFQEVLWGLVSFIKLLVHSGWIEFLVMVKGKQMGFWMLVLSCLAPPTLARGSLTPILLLGMVGQVDSLLDGHNCFGISSRFLQWIPLERGKLTNSAKESLCNLGWRSHYIPIENFIHATYIKWHFKFASSTNNFHSWIIASKSPELLSPQKSLLVVNVNMWCLQGNLKSRAFSLLILAFLKLYIT